MRQKNYPMNFLSIAQNRYTTKMYNGKRIPEDTLNQLKRNPPPITFLYQQPTLAVCFRG